MPLIKISDSNDSSLPFTISRKYFKHLKNVAADIQLQYSGYNPKIHTVYLLALKYQLAVIRQDPVLGILETIHTFKVSIDVSDASQFPIQITGKNSPSQFWVSRQSVLNGCFSPNLSSEIEWNRIRYSRGFLGFIWSNSRPKNSRASKIDLRRIKHGFKIIENLTITTHGSKDLTFFHLSNCNVVSALYCISDSKIYYLDDSNISDDIAWPTNMVFSSLNGNSLLVRSKTSANTIEKAALMGSNSSWFHFLVEILPKYLHARHVPGSEFNNRDLLIRGELPVSILEIIELLNFRSVRSLNDGELVSVRNLFTVNESRFSNVTNMKERQSDLELVRSFLLKSTTKSVNFERVYLKRAKNLFRPLSNRRGVEIRLARLGFVTIKLEELSAFEQIAIFQSAKIVVAESGAALTNIIFMNPNSKVLEIHPGNDEAGLWGTLADVFSVRLEVIYGKQNRIRNMLFGLGSYRLNLKKFTTELANLLKNF